MAKRRSCRRTAEEDRQHGIAVAIRKMTDAQICQKLDEVREQGREAGYNVGFHNGKKQAADTDKSVGAFLSFLQQGKIKGIGVVTVCRLIKTAEEYGYISK